ncbi:DUF2147 domain-containing protein [Maritimibacter sp. UBA3975]|uniref:DUF2147 domain-containing protein n=1 Tax=Maritimibacter sp. UBA3975 TaxID=1946833 RepID=UPI000C09263C|nr:DUF2147 domain-containing protein [Maritimibacter sp. UBA3975]MAM60806.1 hypothetical protein [Maritimibacter sp.]|tara:strand:+ start:20369 stop:20755 length:387 start_codon:yes stop_codon:yes gene_type:complete
MKKLALAAVLAVAGLPAFAQDPALGLWKTQIDDGAYAYVDMYQCGQKVCGRITRTFNDTGEYQSPNIGKALVINMAPQGDGTYKGNVWRPSNDKIYIGKMEVSGNRIDLKGCVAGGLLCANQTWSRIQ